VRLINKNNITKRCTTCFVNLIPKKAGSTIGNCYASNYKNTIYKCNSCYIKLHNKMRVKQRQQKTVGSPIHLSDLVEGARGRANKNNLPFNLKTKDLKKIITTCCPVFGFKFEINKQDKENNWQNSPTIDRIVPLKGYVKENIIIISMLANTIKSCASPDEILKVGNYYKKLYKEKGIKNETS
tara:strand:- start:54 stop:602 length:549 start_codon:yes stop_codon:yes gene_type:complete